MKNKYMGSGDIHQKWTGSWVPAKQVWSPFVKLREPVWCLTSEEAVNEGLQGSFAMIRLSDHRIVIDLEKVKRYGVEDCSLAILAHEIGHHIYTPANLHDNAVLLGRIRWGLADMEDKAPFVSNLYTDLLINDKLHRSKQLDMAAVYQQVNKGIPYSGVWLLMMRTCEYLWKLKRGTLAGDSRLHTPQLDADASLTASLVRSYSKNWLDGAGRFAALFYPYLAEDEKYREARKSLIPLLDAESAGEDGGMIGGLTEIDTDAVAGAVDPRLEALEKDRMASKDPGGTGTGQNEKGGTGPQERYLSPARYIDLMRQVNPNMDEGDLLQNYYREIALPHLIDFPVETAYPTSPVLPEGVDVWETGDPVEEIDWIETAITSPEIIPGFHTRKRVYGHDREGADLQKPLDVYIGMDCSGSMINPRFGFSWPVLAGAVIALSALRAGARVMACLSGEPGSFLETNGFRTVEKEILAVLTSYLGTGYAFGVPRLNTPFRMPVAPQSHVVLVTDNDLFLMLAADTGGKESNWKVMERALKNAGGTGTIVLHSPPGWQREEVKKLQAAGWRIFYVTNEPELLHFAAGFSKANYQQ